MTDKSKRELDGAWVYDDGGRADAGFKGSAGDCTVRAIAIATEKSYQEVYDELYRRNLLVNGNPQKSSPRDGYTRKATISVYLESLGWVWVPTMFVGKGCQTHLKANELPSGRIIARVSKHLVAVIDGLIHDTYDPSRNGTRCVYGYYKQKREG